MPDRPRLIIWGDDAHASLIEAALPHAEVELVAAGCGSEGRDGGLHRALGTEAIRELRETPQRDAEVLWLLDVAGLDAELLRAIRAKGIRVIFGDAWPRSMTDLTDDRGGVERFDIVPRLRTSPAYLEAAQHLEDFGEAQCVGVTVCSRPDQGSLLARLFDAFDVVASLCGEADTVDASLAGSDRPRPESPSELTGHLTVNMRFPERRSATVLASDRAGAWRRRVEVLGAGGVLRITDGGIERIDSDGTVIEDRRDDGDPAEPGVLIGRQIRRLLERRDTPDAPCDVARLLTLSEAARLSCRTAQNESPRNVEAMFRRGGS